MFAYLWKPGKTYDHPSFTMAEGKVWIHYGEPDQTEVTKEMMLELGYELVEDPWQWLASTRVLQAEAYGYTDWPKEGEHLADFVTWNHTAAVKELGEALDEVGWRIWAKPRGWVNREAYISELVDAGHFLANLLLAVDCTDAEWEDRYRAKQAINLKRQRDGYDGVSTKCKRCGRALDDSAVQCTAETCYYDRELES